ncbi:MAG TPA: hypothetical protein DD381_06005 [Lentisphaeria bacterium]|nr:MAG: hypothetical protein A2X47_14100 [Lentisphaerae bacterium GWF2_38_69]HBM15879.1 hypothetical protein [Lentisphaeria bacterium]
MKGREFFTLGAFLVSTVLLAEGISVSTMALKTISPKEIYFTGKVIFAESGNLSFAVDKGIIENTKQVGDVVFPNIYNSDGSIARKGSVVGKVVNYEEIAAYEAARDIYERHLQSGKNFSKMKLEQDKMKVLAR